MSADTMSADKTAGATWPLSTAGQQDEMPGGVISAVTGRSDPTMSDAERVKLFLTIEMVFLLVSFFCGGFHFAFWSMMDSALMIQAIGITALVVVLDQEWMRVLAFRIAVVFYLSSIVAMGVAVLISGVVGWGPLLSLFRD
jgi:hypothetical protein